MPLSVREFSISLRKKNRMMILRIINGRKNPMERMSSLNSRAKDKVESSKSLVIFSWTKISGSAFSARSNIMNEVVAAR